MSIELNPGGHIPSSEMGEQDQPSSPSEMYTPHKKGILEFFKDLGKRESRRDTNSVELTHPTPVTANIPGSETPIHVASPAETMSPMTHSLTPEQTNLEEMHEVGTNTDNLIVGRKREWTSLNNGEPNAGLEADKNLVHDSETSNQYNTENPMRKESYNPQHESNKQSTSIMDANMSRRTFLKGAIGIGAALATDKLSPLEVLAQDKKEENANALQSDTAVEQQTPRELESTSEFFPITNLQMLRTWERTDKPVADGIVNRTWMWGPGARTKARKESYDEAPEGERLVQYFDKSRMEITHPEGDQNSPWYVTNGLLAKELITGKMQVGDNRIEDKVSAHINVAGDPGEDGVTYASFNNEAVLGKVEQKFPEDIETHVIHPDGSITTDESLAQYGVSYKDFRPETGHNIAAPFYDFMNSTGPVFENGEVHNDAILETKYYATGFPITEAYWADVKVGGQSQRVLIQAFERRVLTFNPNNPEGWQVEAGNVGQHYYKWKYGHDFPDPNNPEEDPSCEIGADSPYPKEIKTEKEIFKVINENCDVGFKMGNDPELSFAKMEEAFAKLLPGEKIVIIIKQNPEDVTVGGPDITYDQDIPYERIVPGAPKGKFFYKYDESTQTHTIEMSPLQGIDVQLTDEQKYELNYVPVANAFNYAENRGDIYKDPSPEAIADKIKFGRPEKGEQPLQYVIAHQNSQ